MKYYIANIPDIWWSPCSDSWITDTETIESILIYNDVVFVPFIYKSNVAIENYPITII